ncbi:unnamed protein product [Heterobilharzia americana]|nr:unnamed protein product [Heterobilharzia americana]
MVTSEYTLLRNPLSELGVFLSLNPAYPNQTTRTKEMHCESKYKYPYSDGEEPFWAVKIELIRKEKSKVYVYGHFEHHTTFI